jgi:hypothetical protein
LRYTCHYILLNVHEDGADNVQPEQDQQNGGDIAEINPGSRLMPEKRLVFRQDALEELSGR